MKYGVLTAHAIGVVMKEMVRRAIAVIRKERFIFEAEAKPGASGRMDDLVTSADRKAQAIYVKMITESFPGYGIIAEENDLREECTLPNSDVWFTIDPLDGTKAFGRRQSHGIGTMIALIDRNEVISAYVGDIMTQEVYGFRPESDGVYRTSEFDIPERLTPGTRHLSQQYALLRESPRCWSKLTREMAGVENDDGLFRDIDIHSGSIGIMMARLWKGEVGAVILPAGTQKPWDWAPVVGISRKLGFDFFRITQAEGEDIIIPQPFPNLKENSPVTAEMLVVHASMLGEIRAWAAQRKAKSR